MRWTISLVSVMVVLAAQPSAAQLPAQQVAYSADSVVEFGDERLVWKSFHDRGRERHELSVDGLDQVTILRPDLDRAFVIQPGAAALIELSIEEVTLLPPVAALYAYDAKKLEGAKVNGEQTTRFALTNTKELPGPEKLTIWITDDGVVVQMESQIVVEGELQKVVMEQQNVVRGDQDPMLFDPLYKSVSEGGPKSISLPETMGEDGP